MRTREQARRGLTIYFAVLIVVSAALEGWIVFHGGLSGAWGWLVLPLMYTPALASVVARTVGREGIRDVSFRWGGWTGTRASLAAWLFPVVIGIVAYGTAWASGLADFGPPDGPVNSQAPMLRFLLSLGSALTVGTVMSCLYAFGEEVGWRGYMVPRLVEAEVPSPDVVSGLIWCTWHIPLILWGGYATSAYPLFSAAMFVVSILPVALLYFRWRMTTGSIWPVVIAHGAWNVVIQNVFDRYTHGANAAIWTGESGVLTAATLWLAFVLIRRSAWAGLARSPANV
ncbi:MAG: CPBP family intramembrane glutamic endopeptidase [Gemmatimonadota bacterium]